jgi:hypothetical protein
VQTPLLGLRLFHGLRIDDLQLQLSFNRQSKIGNLAATCSLFFKLLIQGGLLMTQNCCGIQSAIVNQGPAIGNSMGVAEQIGAIPPKVDFGV